MALRRIWDEDFTVALGHCSTCVLNALYAVVTTIVVRAFITMFDCNQSTIVMTFHVRHLV